MYVCIYIYDYICMYVYLNIHVYVIDVQCPSFCRHVEPTKSDLVSLSATCNSFSSLPGTLIKVKRCQSSWGTSSPVISHGNGKCH